MAGVQRIAIVDPSDDTREFLRNTLLGVESVWLEAECSRYDFFADVIAQSSPDVAVVSLDADPERGLRVLQNLANSHPQVDVIACSARSDGQFILQVMRNGAKEFVSLPVQLEEILGALERLRSGRQDRGDRQVSSTIYAFTGSRGGAGSTGLAVNFGCILAQDPANSVALIDLDLAMGDADVCLDIIPDYTLADVALNIDRIDLQLLKRSLSKHSTGLYLLPHPVQIEDAALIKQDHISRVLSLLRMTFTHIILDLSKAYQPMDFISMQLADEIVLVTQLDVSSLRNVVRIMLSLSEREGMDQKVKVVANRVGSSDNEISVAKAEETIGRPIACKIPNDSRTMLGSRNSGVPLVTFAPKSKLFLSILAMSDVLIGREGEAAAAAPVKEKRGFFFFGGGD